MRFLTVQCTPYGFALCAFCAAPGDALAHVETAPPLTGGLTRLEDYAK